MMTLLQNYTATRFGQQQGCKHSCFGWSVCRSKHSTQIPSPVNESLESVIGLGEQVKVEELSTISDDEEDAVSVSEPPAVDNEQNEPLSKKLSGKKDRKKFKCGICHHYTTVKTHRMITHLKTHKQNKCHALDGFYHCSSCLKCYVTEADIEKHLKKHHKGSVHRSSSLSKYSGYNKSNCRHRHATSRNDSQENSSSDDLGKGNSTHALGLKRSSWVEKSSPYFTEFQGKSNSLSGNVELRSPQVIDLEDNSSQLSTNGETSVVCLSDSGEPHRDYSEKPKEVKSEKPSGSPVKSEKPVDSSVVSKKPSLHMSGVERVNRLLRSSVNPRDCVVQSGTSMRLPDDSVKPTRNQSKLDKSTLCLDDDKLDWDNLEWSSQRSDDFEKSIYDDLDWAFEKRSPGEYEGPIDCKVSNPIKNSTGHFASDYSKRKSPDDHSAGDYSKKKRPGDHSTGDYSKRKSPDDHSTGDYSKKKSPGDHSTGDCSKKKKSPGDHSTGDCSKKSPDDNSAKKSPVDYKIGPVHYADDKSLQCSICSKKLTSPGIMTVHMNIHGLN